MPPKITSLFLLTLHLSCFHMNSIQSHPIQDMILIGSIKFPLFRLKLIWVRGMVEVFVILLLLNSPFPANLTRTPKSND